MCDEFGKDTLKGCGGWVAYWGFGMRKLGLSAQSCHRQCGWQIGEVIMRSGVKHYCQRLNFT